MGQVMPWFVSPAAPNRTPPTAHTDLVKPHAVHVTCQSLDSVATFSREDSGTIRCEPFCRMVRSSNCDQSSRYHDRSGGENTETDVPSRSGAVNRRPVVRSTIVTETIGSP